MGADRVDDQVAFRVAVTGRRRVAVVLVVHARITSLVAVARDPRHVALPASDTVAHVVLLRVDARHIRAGRRDDIRGGVDSAVCRWELKLVARAFVLAWARAAVVYVVRAAVAVVAVQTVAIVRASRNFSVVCRLGASAAELARRVEALVEVDIAVAPIPASSA